MAPISPIGRVRWAGAVVAVALLAACATGGGANTFSDDPGDSGEIEIRVDNLNFSDATVWAIVQDSRRQRLGIVTGKTQKTFTMRWPTSEYLRMEFDLLAGFRCWTERLAVDPGDLVELQIVAQPTADDNCR